MSKLTVAAITKVVKPLFKRKKLGTAALASYELTGDAVPKLVLKACGGKAKATKNDDKQTNRFYTVTVADQPLYLYYYRWQPNPKQFDGGGEGIDVFTADGESIGNGNLTFGEDAEVEWGLDIAE